MKNLIGKSVFLAGLIFECAPFTAFATPSVSAYINGSQFVASAFNNENKLYNCNGQYVIDHDEPGGDGPAPPTTFNKFFSVPPKFRGNVIIHSLPYAASTTSLQSWNYTCK